MKREIENEMQEWGCR